MSRKFLFTSKKKYRNSYCTIQDVREELWSYQSDLQQLVDAPSPIAVGTAQQQQLLVQQEQGEILLYGRKFLDFHIFHG